MILSSPEHSCPLQAKVTYKADMVSDALVCIYDDVVARRDEPWLVERKVITGKTPEQIKAHFALKFVPQFICDANIPVGESITMATLTNAAGQTARIFRANTRLELRNERQLPAR